MPIFEYTCTKCEIRFEKLVAATGQVVIECPACGSSDVKKELSAFSTGAAPSAACFSGG